MLQVCRSSLLLILFLVLTAMARGEDDAERRLFDKVMARLLSSDVVAKNYPAKYHWPPRCFVKPDSARELNAFASAAPELGATVEKGKVRPVVMITEGSLKKIVKGDENLLAVMMGHELAHVTRDHVAGRQGKTSLLYLAFSRDQEIEADLEGMKAVVSAGYPYRAGLDSTIREMSGRPNFSSFEGLHSSHPSWQDRLRFLDRKQPQLWKAMAAFKNGQSFLEFEQYLAAEQCFRAVVDEFPDCHDAWANLGYAKLMRYCDGLRTADVRELHIGQVVAGAFYTRPPGPLQPLVRPFDPALWTAAVKALKQALTLKPDLVLARANLALAHLVHPTLRNDPDNNADITRWFAEALENFPRDPELKDNALALAAVLVNAGVADLASGDLQHTADKFTQAGELARETKFSGLIKTLEDALLYNQALLEERAGKDENAWKSLERFLKRSCPDSAWWPLAFERYEKLGQKLGKPIQPLDQLARRRGPDFLRVLTSVDAGSGAIVLSQPMSDAVERLGRKAGVEVPLFEGSSIVRWQFADRGIDLLGKEEVLAIFLKSAKAPPVIVEPIGVAVKGRPLRVGMSEEEAAAILRNQRVDKALCSIDDPNVQYRFYPELGLATRALNGRIAELVLAQVPRRSFADGK